MPVYNGADTVAEALDQLLGQTFRDIEIIISDNASTDATPDICRAYAARDRRVRYFRQPTLLRIGDNFAFVLHEARGEFFMWAADDDGRELEFVMRLMTALDAEPNAILAFGDLVEITDKGSSAVSFDFVNVGLSARRRLRSAAFRQCFHIYGLWRTNAIRRVRWAHNEPWADTPIMMAAAMLGDFIRVPGVEFRYYQHRRRYFRWERHPGLPGLLRDIGILAHKLGQFCLLIGQSARAVATVSDRRWGLVAAWYAFLKVVRQFVGFRAQRRQQPVDPLT